MVARWSIPRLWHGDTVAILASGPSMSQAVADRVRAAGICAIAINNTYRLAPWADVLYAADRDWWNHTPDAASFAGVKISCERVPAAHCLHNAGGTGYSDEPWMVHTYGNSGAQAIQVAAKAGAGRILLCGMDMRVGHWHGDHKYPLRNAEPEHYVKRAKRMDELAGHLDQRGVDVLNCTPGSALTCWPMVDLEEVLSASENTKSSAIGPTSFATAATA